MICQQATRRTKRTLSSSHSLLIPSGEIQDFKVIIYTKTIKIKQLQLPDFHVYCVCHTMFPGARNWTAPWQSSCSQASYEAITGLKLVILWVHRLQRGNRWTATRQSRTPRTLR
eukprot:TRINITY_DN551_c0_g1_i1.p1 TRINITY_DN551_c0_g1~~TRINITY_DN551_c0_g1_i1.p1  ORF type:complete len:114 (-),score=13.83 TRINITY_DN551_c0_g1_i1:71-412(-)